MTDTNPIPGRDEAASTGSTPVDVVAIGRIGKAHGVRGDAFVEPWTDTPADRFVDGAVFATDPADRGPLTVSGSRDHSGKLVVHFDGVDDRNAIEVLRGTVLVMPAAARPPITDPDEFYDTDLIGLSVRTVGGRQLGPVADVLHSPAGSLLAIEFGRPRGVAAVSAGVRTDHRSGGRGRRDRSAGRAAGAVTDPEPTDPGATDPGSTDPEPQPDLTVDVITIFPDYLAPLRESLLGKAIDRGQVRLGVHDLRQWTTDVHRTVDDSPYGGGPGMVMLAEPWAKALDAIAPPAGAVQPRLVIPSPTGRLLRQSVAAELAEQRWLIFACGRYEGIDARVAEYASDRMVVDEISLGDYVLCGGEVAVLVMMEAIARLIPGVLGNDQSALQDSFTEANDGLLEAPAYTKPASWRGREVPPVLLSGHHARIEQWRREQSRARSLHRRPDLLEP